MKDLVIVGAGDFGREVSSLVERINEEEKKWNLIGFVDDDLQMLNKVIDGYPVVGTSKWLSDRKAKIHTVCSLGESRIRRSVIERIDKYPQVKYATLIDPNATLMHGAKIREGSIICAGTVLSINVDIGKHSIINLNCTIGHDTVVGEYFTVHPGSNISGKVIVGDDVYLGSGTTVIQGVHIISETVLGAGAVVISDIDEQGTYVGVPAKKVK